jgi:25S rRNA (uracil2634-N3)-methyltransferase
LLVKFLKEAKGLLETAPPGSQPHWRASMDEKEDDDEDYDSEDVEEDDKPEAGIAQEETATSKLAKEHATILVTLFESEPYTLWNIKDLARHVGLKSITSFAFPWNSYPGYRHARTIGTIEGKGGAWKGEERAARTYVFGLKEEEAILSGATGANAVEAKRKRGRGRESESESEEE